MSSSYVVTKTAWRDGSTHQVMSALEFMQRLAALMPRPRLHLIRFHGVLAPNAKLRAKVVPKPEQAPTQQTRPDLGEAQRLRQAIHWLGEAPEAGV